MIRIENGEIGIRGSMGMLLSETVALVQIIGKNIREAAREAELDPGEKLEEFANDLRDAVLLTEEEMFRKKRDQLLGLLQEIMNDDEEEENNGSDDDGPEEPDGVVETPAGLYRWIRRQCSGGDEPVHD